jgi:hypothetical protein
MYSLYKADKELLFQNNWDMLNRQSHLNEIDRLLKDKTSSIYPNTTARYYTCIYSMSAISAKAILA